MKFKALIIAATLAATGLGAQAANAGTLLSDNFDSENGGVGQLNYYGLANFNVTGGAVDLIGNGFFDFYPGNGLYVDVCGSVGVCGTLQSKQTFGPGTYSVTLDLGGNARGGPSDTTLVNFGSFAGSYTLGNTQLATETFTTTLTGPSQLTIGDAGLDGGNVGNILLSVNVSTAGVPEPATWATMLIGVAGLGASLRLRRRAALAA